MFPRLKSIALIAAACGAGLLGWLTPVPPVGVAFAQEQAADEQAAKTEDEQNAEAAAEAEEDAITGGGETSAEQPLFEFSAGELEVLRRLAARRQELDARDAAIVERERLVAALEAKLAEQAAELRRLKASLEEQETRVRAENDGVDQAAKDRVKNLAAAYRSMKPKDAARLFDELEMESLIQIAREISPRVLAPVMAKMKPERARALTQALTES